MTSRTDLRILYVQPSEFFGGEERHLVTSVPLLAAHGIDVLPLVGPGNTIVEWLHERSIRNFEFSADFPGNWGRRRGLARLALLARYRRCRARVAATIEGIVRHRDIDLVYAAMPFSWAAATPVARALGVPIVWRAGGPVWLSGRVLGSIVLAPWAMLHPPDLLICSSERVRRTFAGLVPAPKVAVINGVDTDHFHPGAADPGRLRPTDAEAVVGFAGRLVARKGIETFLAVAGRMARARPRLRWLVAGDGIHRAEYEACARAAGAAGNTLFLGYVADMRQFYAACDVIVLPSHSEGASMVVLEAMAMGCAVVVSDIPSLRELVRHDEHGILVPPGDDNALEAALNRLCGDSKWRTALTTAAGARVRDRFNAQSATARVATLLESIAAQACGRKRCASFRSMTGG